MALVCDPTLNCAEKLPNGGGVRQDREGQERDDHLHGNVDLITHGCKVRNKSPTLSTDFAKLVTMVRHAQVIQTSVERAYFHLI